MLDIEVLFQLEEQIKEELDEHLEEILIKLNRDDKIDELLVLLGMKEIIEDYDETYENADGIIIVVGQSEVEKEKLLAVAKNYGLGKDRFEFYLEYEDAKKFDFRKTQWSSKYSCILVGQMPHSGYAKGDYGSVISALEKQDGYPPVVRMGLSGGLKISKTSFRTTIEYVLNENIVA